ncbi:MAG: hypothetical protein IKZ10_04930, partial [Akkermansia sp.]|nr:hypothetical protein [Akkermansia sp.]
SGVLWYNKTMNDALRLADPYQQSLELEWNWQNFKDYMQSVPKTNKNGQQLRRFSPKFHDHIDHQQALDWHTVCNIPPQKRLPPNKKSKN